MCLGYPGYVVSVDGTSAEIDCWGVRKVASFDPAAEPLQPGDFVIEHEGTVVRRIPAEEIDTTVEMYETVMVEA